MTADPGCDLTEARYRITSWVLVNLHAVIQAERKWAQRGAPAYVYLLAWESPAGNGEWKCGHGLDLPLMFDNVAMAPHMVAEKAEDAQYVADAMSAAWIAFARSGHPGWDRYDGKRRPTMVFDVESRPMDDPLSLERGIFMACEA